MVYYTMALAMNLLIREQVVDKNTFASLIYSESLIIIRPVEIYYFRFWKSNMETGA